MPDAHYNSAHDEDLHMFEERTMDPDATQEELNAATPETVQGTTQEAAQADKRTVAMSLAMPFYPIPRPWTTAALLVTGQVDAEAYVDALGREVLSAAPDFDDCRFPAVWIGGGIAGHIADERLGDLLRQVRQSYDLTTENGSPAEITLTVYPGMVSAATLDVCRRGHMTRLQLDYASSSAAEWREIKRFMSPEVMEVTKTVIGAERLELAFELLVGLPGQTVRSAAASLKAALDYGAVEIDLCSFEIDSASILAQERAGHDDEWRAQIPHRLPASDECNEIVAALAEQLLTEGFAEYLPGRWALPQHASRYHMMRAQGYDYLGFGLGAPTRFDGVAARNTADLATYLEFSDIPAKCIVESGPIDPRH